MRNRIAELINLLLGATQPLTGMQLAQLIQVSPRTVAKDLQTIKEVFAECGYTLISKRGTGYYLELSEAEKNDLRKRLGICGDGQHAQQIRLLSIMDAVFLSDRAVTLSALAAKFGVSKSCILSDIQTINAYIHRYQVDLQVKRNAGVVFCGKELAIRYSYLSFRESNAEYIRIPLALEQMESYIKLLKFVSAEFAKVYLRVFPSIAVCTVVDSIVLAEKKLNVSFTESSWENILQYIALAILRPEHMPQFDDEKIKDKRQIKESNEYYAAKEMAAYLLRKAGGYICENEICYLGLCMQANSRQDSMEDILERTAQIDKSTLDSAHALLQYFSELLKYPFDKDDTAELLAFYIERMRIKNNCGLEWFAARLCPAATQNNDVLVACLSAHNVVENLLGFQVDNADLFHIAICLDNAMNSMPKHINALYITREEYPIAKQQMNLIRSSVPGIQFIKAIQSSKLSNEEARKLLSNQNVLVCSTFPLQIGVPICHQVIISSRFKATDAQAINLELYKMRNSGPNPASDKPAGRPHIIAHVKHYDDAKQVLHSGCALLRRMGYAYQGYEADVVCKEITQPSALENGVAIPHSSPQFVKESAVYLIKLDAPVIWSNGESVDLVFFLALGANTGESIKQNASWVYGFINNPEILSLLRTAQSTDELMDILKTI